MSEAFNIFLSILVIIGFCAIFWFIVKSHQELLNTCGQCQMHNDVQLGNGARDELDKIIQILYNHANKWSDMALQDNMPIISILHANYGVGFLWAIKDIATSEDFKRVTGRELLEFEANIIKTQDMASKKLIAICPQNTDFLNVSGLSDLRYTIYSKAS